MDPLKRDAIPEFPKRSQPILSDDHKGVFHSPSTSIQPMIDTDAFLRQEVESATPAKLRWLLLQKAHGLTLSIRDFWQRGQFEEAKQWLILTQDIFSELLEGIVDPKHELAKQQSDLFVFLTKLLILAGQTQDVKTLGSVVEILEIEKDTWEMLVRKETSNYSSSHSSHSQQSDNTYAGFDLEA
jgi:flagellar secretion chaperone FliS